MPTLTALLSQYQATFTAIQKIGSEAYSNHIADATKDFKLARNFLAEQYAQPLLDEFRQKSNYSERLNSIFEISNTLSSIPVQANSDASVLVTFSYSFLRDLSDGIWGFPKDISDAIYQKDCSDKIVYAVCGKQTLETKARNVLPNHDVVTIALQYLFICQHQGILSSDKHANVKKSIDVHFKLNNDLLEAALTSLYDGLNSEDQQKFITLIDGVTAQFTNIGIKQALLRFKASKMLAIAATLVSSKGSSDVPESFDGSEAAIPADSNKILNAQDEKIEPRGTKENPYGAIGTPRKKVEVKPDQLQPVNTPESTPAVVKKNIIWGVPSSDEIREDQLESFKTYYLKEKNDNSMRVCIALQFVILLKKDRETIYAPKHWPLAMNIILSQSPTALLKALSFIKSQLATNEERINFIRVLSKVAYSFKANRYSDYSTAIESYRKDLQAAIKIYDENVIILNKINAVDDPCLKPYHAELLKKNEALAHLIDASVSSTSQPGVFDPLYEEIKILRQRISLMSDRTGKENNDNSVQNGLHCSNWREKMTPTQNKNKNINVKGYLFQKSSAKNG